MAAADVARVVAALLADPQAHVGRIYELTGPRSQDMHGVAKEFSGASVNLSRSTQISSVVADLEAYCGSLSRKGCRQ